VCSWRLGFTVSDSRPDGMTAVHKRRYVADVHLEFAQDSESMLLPDFGSRTEGNYRLCLLPALPEEGELTDLAARAGNRATILLVTEVVSQERRASMAVQSMGRPAAASPLRASPFPWRGVETAAPS
jgi:hypothetical protein